MNKERLDLALTFGFFEPLWAGDQVPASETLNADEVQEDEIQKGAIGGNKSLNLISSHRSSLPEIEYVDEEFPQEPDFDPWIEEKNQEESDEDVDEDSEEKSPESESGDAREKQLSEPMNLNDSSENSTNSETIESGLQLTEIANRFGPFSSSTGILGLCEDGLPFLIDFNDPTPGSMLIVSDRNEWNTYHLESFLASVCMLNSPDKVQLGGIGPSLKCFREIPFSAHQGLKVGRVPDLESYALLEEMFSLVENRRSGSVENTPIYVFAIDQLDFLIEQLDKQSLSFFRWLVKRGPFSNVWVIATISAKSSFDIDWKTLRSFGTILAGNISDKKIARTITGYSHIHVKNLLPGKQSCVKLGDEVIRYMIPPPKVAG